MNSARKMAGAALACGAAARMRSAAKYSGMAAARPSTMSRTMNRTLSRWSPSSLAAMTRQPACGTRAFDAAGPRLALDGGVGGDGRGAHSGLRRLAVRAIDFRFSPAGLTGGRSTALR